MAPSTGNTPQLPEENLAPLDDKIRFMMRMDDFASLGQVLSELMTLPQSLCKQQGECCRVVIFKGAPTHEKLLAMRESDDPIEASNANDFLDLFVPIPNQAAVRETEQRFIEKLRDVCPDGTDATLYQCRFLGQDRRCQIHEDRPTGCRVYPIVHEKSIFYDGCGYEETAKRNLTIIKAIEAFFHRRIQELQDEAMAVYTNSSEPMM